MADQLGGGLRVAVIHFGFFYSGGGEKLVLEEVRGLQSLGHDVTCFAPYVDRANCFPNDDEMRSIKSLLPAAPTWVPLRHAISVIACCVLAPLFAYRFAKFDVILAANQPALWIAMIVGELLRKPYVAYLAQPFRLLHPRNIDLNHGLQIRDGDQRFVHWITHVGRPLINWADRTSVRKASYVLTNGKYATQWIGAIYNVASINCPAGCYPDRELEVSQVDRWAGILEVGAHAIRKPFILVTNRHAPHKRFEYSLWALKAVRRIVPDVSLVITGQPSTYTEQLRYLSQGMGLEGSVIFVGLIPESDLSVLYRNAAVYVYPAPEEDFGMGIIEAMAAATPVVAWDNAGPTGIVDNLRTGYLVRPFDTDIFAERIADLLVHRKLSRRLGEAGLRRARSLFTYRRHNVVVAETLRLAAARLEAAETSEPPAVVRPSRLEATAVDVRDEVG